MITPVLLSGGSGTRLWPLSRQLYPKQFLNLVSNNTLFQETILRLPKNVSSPIIVCNEEHRFIVSEQLSQIGLQNKNIVLEPVGKNTAPAIALAALNALKDGDDPILLVLSADHLIGDNQNYHRAIEIGGKEAENGKVVVLGSKPYKPEIGYGYIKVDKSIEKDSYNIISFTEKPDFKKAKKYFESGRYLWNTGIFMFKASVYLEELKKYDAEIYSICKKSFSKVKKDLDFLRINSKEFIKCPSKSIDYSVMENTKIGIAVNLESPWSDIGSWDALWDSKTKDTNNNVIEGDVIANNVKNSFIFSANRLVTANDINNVVIIDTQDALLVSNKESSQDIKHIVKLIDKENRAESMNHRKVYRPWGYYDSIDTGNGFQVKRIFVNPNAKLSLQKHYKRDEHWVVINGTALITCNEKVFVLKENQSTYIPRGAVHRLENYTNETLEIIEIQTGDYLGEDDIIRLEDDYSRI